MISGVYPSEISAIDATVWNYFPPSPVYEAATPTSSSLGFVPGPHLRRPEVTSDFIDGSLALAICSALSSVAASLQRGLGQTQAVVTPGTDLVVFGPARAITRTEVGPDQRAQVVVGLRSQIEQSSGLSRQEIARILGVDRRSLSGWASGETPPSERNLNRLRTLATVAERLARLGIYDLTAALTDAATVASFTAAVRAGAVTRAVTAVTGLSATADAPEPAPELTPAQWAALRLLLERTEDGTEEQEDMYDPEGVRPLSRVPLETKDYATPRRPRLGAAGG